jgi:hypothetical protein
MSAVSREDLALRDMVRRLERVYNGRRSREQVLMAVLDARQEFHDSHIRDFVPVFVERMAQRILDGLEVGQHHRVD